LVRFGPTHDEAEGLAMKQAPLRLLLLAALTASTATAFAQGKGKGKESKPAAEVEDLGGDDVAAPPKEPPKGDSKPASTGGGTSGSSFLCEENPDACDTGIIIKKYAEQKLKDSQVYAVQQIFALRRGRFDLSPYWASSLNDQFVAHAGPGIAGSYYVTNVLAIGLNFNYYSPFNSEADFNRLVRQSTRLAVPITEYQWGANLNFTYVPLYGKFAGFGDFIFHWDAYVIGGIGAISTRPKAVIDPENRSFSFTTKVAFNAGLGFRVFFNRWVAAFLEVRDYAYLEKLEDTNVQATDADRRNPANWYAPTTNLTNAIQAQFGLSFFLPTSWTYRLPK
jgi:outer membrane beta-barrel protein